MHKRSVKYTCAQVIQARLRNVQRRAFQQPVKSLDTPSRKGFSFIFVTMSIVNAHLRHQRYEKLQREGII